MKILILTTTFPRWKNDSTPAFIYEQSKRLREFGFEIILLAPHHLGAKRFEIMDGMRIYRFPYFYPVKYQKLSYEGGILPRLRNSHLAKIQAPLLFSFELYYALKIIKKENIDIIQSHWLIPSGLIGAICKKFTGKKHVATELAAGLAALDRLPLKKRISIFIVNNCDKITFLSGYLYERLLQLDKFENLNYKLEIIPLGIDISRFRPNANKYILRKKYNINSKNVLLFIGRIVEKKGLIFLIKAMPEIMLKNPDTELIICGDGPLKKEYERLILKMNLEDSIRFVGYISDENIKIEYLSLSDILIVPSILTKFGDTEGLGVVLLEGLATGTPVIASNIGGIPDIIKDGENGFLTEPENSEDIAKNVGIILSDKILKQEFSNNGLKIVYEKFSWEVVIKKISKIYNELNKVP